MKIHTTGISTQAFEEVFKSHFKALYAYAYTILKEDIMAEEMVQKVFCKLWEKKDAIQIEQSLPAYLYRAVYNECLNHLKHENVKRTYQSYVMHTTTESVESAGKKVMLRELEHKIAEALKRLPEQCRTIFQLSRFEELKYREIADKLNLSVKTVENQMGKALKIMRTQLKEYLPVWCMAALLFLYG